MLQVLVAMSRLSVISSASSPHWHGLPRPLKTDKRGQSCAKIVLQCKRHTRAKASKLWKHHAPQGRDFLVGLTAVIVSLSPYITMMVLLSLQMLRQMESTRQSGNVRVKKKSLHRQLVSTSHYLQWLHQGLLVPSTMTTIKVHFCLLTTRYAAYHSSYIKQEAKVI